MKRTPVYINENLHDRLKVVSEKSGIPITRLLEFYVKYGLKNLKEYKADISETEVKKESVLDKFRNNQFKKEENDEEFFDHDD